MTGNAERTRNIAIIGIGASGKTQLADTLLFNARAVPAIGKVIDRTSNMVLEQEEFEHLTTITASLATIELNGVKFNIIDTPSQDGFIAETVNTLQAVDGAIFLMSAQTDIKQEAEMLIKYAGVFNLPLIFLINKMDGENADFYTALHDYSAYLNVKLTPVAVPIGSGEKFEGIYSIADKKAYLYPKDASGRARQVADGAPADAGAFEKEFIEAVAESDDALLEKYLNNEKMGAEELFESAKKSVLSRNMFPVMPGSALFNMGVDKLMEICSLWMPSHSAVSDRVVLRAPGGDGEEASEIKRDSSGKPVLFIFKTVIDPYAGKMSYARVFSGRIGQDTVLYNASTGTEEKTNHIYTMIGSKSKLIDSAESGDIIALAKLQASKTGDTLKAWKDTLAVPRVYRAKKLVSYAVKPRGKSDEDKVTQTLNKIIEEDTSLSIRRDTQLKELILEGVSKEQLEIVMHKTRRKYGIDLELVLPDIPYKETIKGRAEAQGKYKKQSGGRGQYGDVWVKIEPLQRGKGIEFVDNIVGGAIPRQYIPAVEKGIRDAAGEGFVAGFPVIDFVATAYDGSYHVVDSSELAFKIAGSFAFKKCMELANPVVLEPIMLITVAVPESFTGEVIGGLNSKRAKILGMDQDEGKKQVIKAHVPLSEVQSYGDELRSITKGMGTFDIEYFGYEEVPAHIAEKIISSRNKKDVKV
ncbi:MAG: elongation factor G [Deltaproteobacteria bacterium]|nr:elongation factor G [Deltaproteobacteria bacterium]MCL5277711.1 elongation factor G [Deltaproteobacteria bacterium]